MKKVQAVSEDTAIGKYTELMEDEGYSMCEIENFFYS